MSAFAKLSTRMTVAEFLRWNPDDGARYELVDGEPRAMAPASAVHGFLQNELGRLIGNHLAEHLSNCVAIANPGVVPRLLSDHNVRVPDLAVTCSTVLPGQATLPDPVLIVEILSPSDQAKTWANVWAYTSIPGVQEILILRSDRMSGEILSRSSAGEWPERTTPIAGGAWKLETIGFRLVLADLYSRTGIG